MADYANQAEGARCWSFVVGCNALLWHCTKAPGALPGD